MCACVYVCVRVSTCARGQKKNPLEGQEALQETLQFFEGKKVRAHTHTNAHAHVCTYSLSLSLSLSFSRTHPLSHTHIRTHTHACAHTHTHTHTYSHIVADTNSNPTRTRVYTQSHTHSRTRVHTHTSCYLPTPSVILPFFPIFPFPFFWLSSSFSFPLLHCMTPTCPLRIIVYT